MLRVDILNDERENVMKEFTAPRQKTIEKILKHEEID